MCYIDTHIYISPKTATKINVCGEMMYFVFLSSPRTAARRIYIMMNEMSFVNVKILDVFVLRSSRHIHTHTAAAADDDNKLCDHTSYVLYGYRDQRFQRFRIFSKIFSKNHKNRFGAKTHGFSVLS